MMHIFSRLCMTAATVGIIIATATSFYGTSGAEAAVATTRSFGANCYAIAYDYDAGSFGITRQPVYSVAKAKEVALAPCEEAVYSCYIEVAYCGDEFAVLARGRYKDQEGSTYAVARGNTLAKAKEEAVAKCNKELEKRPSEFSWDEGAVSEWCKVWLAVGPDTAITP